MENHYGGVIWTKHAMLRLVERGIGQQEALVTLQHPQRTRYAQAQHAWVYNRTFGNQDIEVVASQNEHKEWVVVSVWSRTYRNSHRYLVRNGIVDWLLDRLVALWKR